MPDNRRHQAPEDSFPYHLLLPKEEKLASKELVRKIVLKVQHFIFQNLDFAGWQKIRWEDKQ